MYSLGLGRMFNLMMGRPGGSGPTLGGLIQVIQGTQTANLRWYFPCDETEASKPATDTVLGRTLSGEGGGDGLVDYGVPGQSGTAIAVDEFGSLERNGGDGTLFNIFDATAGFTFGILVKPQVVGDVDGVVQFNDTGTSTRFIIRMEALGKVFVGLLLPGNNQNLANRGVEDHFEVGVWAWTFLRMAENGVIDLFHNTTKTASIGTNNNHTGTDGELSTVTIGRSSTNRSEITFQHVCGWDTPLSDLEIANIVSGSGV